MSVYPGTSQNVPQVITKDGNRFMLVELPDQGDSDPGNDSPFQTKQSRGEFLRKVYGILTIQLLITLAIVYYTVNSFDASLWIRENLWVLYLSMALTFVLMFTISCCPHLGRSFPCNFILLGVLTVCKCLLTTVICWYYRTEDILLAMGITVGVFVALSLFALQTKWDFTVLSGLLVVSSLLLMIIGIVTIFFKDRTLHIVYCALVVLVVAMAIVIDTQLMLIGKHSLSFGPKDYVLAALVLYSDIITLFVYVLRLIGLVNDD